VGTEHPTPLPAPAHESATAVRWGPQLIAQDGRDRGDRSPVIEGVVRHLQPAPPMPEPVAEMRQAGSTEEAEDHRDVRVRRDLEQHARRQR
jgi:hypothetical protein